MDIIWRIFLVILGITLFLIISTAGAHPGHPTGDSTPPITHPHPKGGPR